MAWSTRGDSFKTILKIVVGTVFTVVALAVLYKAATTSSEKRSKAAPAEIVYKAWEFNGASPEGWIAKNINSLAAKNGQLVGIMTAEGGYIINRTGSIPMKFGTKRLILRTALSVPGAVKRLPTKDIVSQNPARVTNASFVLDVSYTSNGAKRSLPSVRGIADGVLRDYSLTFLSLAAETVDSIQITVSSVRPGTTLRIDHIRLTGSASIPPSTMTPKPPPPATMTPKPTSCPIVCDKFGKCISACPSSPKPTSITTPRPVTPSPTQLQPVTTSYTPTPMQPVAATYTPTPSP